MTYWKIWESELVSSVQVSVTTLKFKFYHSGSKNVGTETSISQRPNPSEAKDGQRFTSPRKTVKKQWNDFVTSHHARSL